jgi:hypothetical protein
VKLMMVPYISRPPTIDMAAAPPAITAECQRRVGRAIAVSIQWRNFTLLDQDMSILFNRHVLSSAAVRALTDSHNHKETRQEPPKVNNARS